MPYWSPIEALLEPYWSPIGATVPNLNRSKLSEQAVGTGYPEGCREIRQGILFCVAFGIQNGLPLFARAQVFGWGQWGEMQK